MQITAAIADAFTFTEAAFNVAEWRKLLHEVVPGVGLEPTRCTCTNGF